MTKTTKESKRARKENRECARYHVWLYEEDIIWVDQNVDAINRSKFIRLALHRVVRNMKAKAKEEDQLVELAKEE